MASSYKTPNLELSNYVEDDKPTMWDYNEDMERIDGLAGGVDTLAADLRGHLHHKSNPHEVTAGQVDTYTRAEMDALLFNKANADKERDMYELPLASGINPSVSNFLHHYSKNEFDEVFLSFSLEKPVGPTGYYYHLATLPVGFRPRLNVVTGGGYYLIEANLTPVHYVIYPSGIIQVHRQKIFPSQQADFFLTVMFVI